MVWTVLLAQYVESMVNCLSSLSLLQEELGTAKVYQPVWMFTVLKVLQVYCGFHLIATSNM